VGSVNSVVLVLPYPPSLNAIFRRFNGSHLSEDYRKWRDDAGWELVRQKPRPIAGPVAIEVQLTAPDKRRRDLDNSGFKAVIDLLVKHSIIEADDSRIVRKIQAEWASTGVPCTVTVRAI
jgi:Holliday junction resolvase RusA-like endonuclease